MKLWGVGQIHEHSNEDLSEEISFNENKHPKPVIQPKPEPPITTETTQEQVSEKIETGKHRLNVLHSYEPNYSTPSLYAYFMEGNRLLVTPDDSYIDYEPNCRLALAVKQREKGWLVFTYEDGNVVKFSLDLLLDFSPNETRDHYSGSKLRFVNIAGENDYLLTVLKASYGAIFYRLDTLHNMDITLNLKDSGSPLCDNQHTIIAQEIVGPDKLIFLDSDAIDKERRFFGVPLPVGDGTLTEEERIEELLRPLFMGE